MVLISSYYPRRRWLILAASFYLNLVVDGFCFIFGILAISIQAAYPNTHPSVVSLIGGIVPTLYNGLAPIGIALVEHYGSRTVTIGASIVSTLGFVFCWMNETFFQGGFWFDFLTIGVIEGISFALLYGPSINTIPTYFDQNTKSLAIGITTCGSAAGAIFFGFIIHFLIEAFGWRGTLLAFAVFSLNGVIAALTFPTPNELAYVRLLGQKEEDEEDEKTSKENKKSFITRYFDVSVFAQYSFMFVLAAASFSMIGYYIPVILVPSQSLLPQYGVSQTVQLNIILIWGTANLIGRLISGRLGDYGRTHKKLAICTSYWLYIIGHVVSGVALIVFPHTMQLGDASFVTFVIVYGFFIAPLITMRSVLVVDLYGEENSSSCFGWFLGIQGLTQIIGYVLPTFLDTLDSVWSYLFGAVCFLGSAACVAATGFVYFRERRRRFAAKIVVTNEKTAASPAEMAPLTGGGQQQRSGNLTPIAEVRESMIPPETPRNIKTSLEQPI